MPSIPALLLLGSLIRFRLWAFRHCVIADITGIIALVIAIILPARD